MTLALLSWALPTLLATAPALTAQDSSRLRHLVPGDQNGDGRTDLYVAASSGGRLFLRDSKDRLTPAAPGVIPPVPGRSARWWDADEDGDLDLWVWGSDLGHLLINESGTMQDRTREAGIRGVPGIVRHADWVDFDGDARMDMLLASTDGLFLAHNLGGGRFEVSSLGESSGDKPLSTSGMTHEVHSTVTQPMPPNNGWDGTGILRGVAPGGTVSTQEPAGAATGASGAPHALPRPGFGPGREPILPPATSQLTAPTPTGGAVANATQLEDALGGACLAASTIPTLGMLMPLSSEFFVDAALGYLGLGTTSPAVRLHLPYGSEATGVSGGIIQFGSSSGLNIAIDGDEIAARNNGVPVPLYLNHEGGDVIVAGSAGAGLGVGASPRPGASSYYHALLVADPLGGDGSVVLPSDSISPSETLAEAGTSNAASSSTPVVLNGYIELSIATAQMSVPSSGWLVVISSADIEVPSTASSYLIRLRTLDDQTTNVWSEEHKLIMLPGETRHVSWTKVLPASYGSSHTLTMRALAEENTGTGAFVPGTAYAKNSTLQVMYFPTQYGTVVANGVSYP